MKITIIFILCFLIQTIFAYEAVKTGELIFNAKHSANSLEIRNNYAYTVLDYNIRIIDITNNNKPYIHDNIPNDPSDRILSLFIQDEYLYALTTHNELIIFKIKGDTFTFISKFEIINDYHGNYRCKQMKIVDDTIYLIISCTSKETNSLIAINIKNKEKPEIVDPFSEDPLLQSRTFSCIDASKNYIYITDSNNMTLLSFVKEKESSNLKFVGRLFLIDDPQSIVVNENFAHIKLKRCSKDSEKNNNYYYWIIDTRNPKKLKKIKTISTGFNDIENIAIIGDYSFVSIAKEAIYVYRTKNNLVENIFKIQREFGLCIMSDKPSDEYIALILKMHPDIRYFIYDNEIHAVKNKILKKIGEGDWIKEITSDRKEQRDVLMQLSDEVKMKIKSATNHDPQEYDNERYLKMKISNDCLHLIYFDLCNSYDDYNSSEYFDYKTIKYEIINICDDLNKITIKPENRTTSKYKIVKFTAEGEYDCINFEEEKKDILETYIIPFEPMNNIKNYFNNKKTKKDITNEVYFESTNLNIASFYFNNFAITANEGVTTIIAKMKKNDKIITNETFLNVYGNEENDKINDSDEDELLKIFSLLALDKYIDDGWLYNTYEVLTDKNYFSKKGDMKRLIFETMLSNKKIKNFIFKNKIKFFLQNKDKNFNSYLMSELISIILDKETKEDILYEIFNCIDTYIFPENEFPEKICSNNFIELAFLTPKTKSLVLNKNDIKIYESMATTLLRLILDNENVQKNIIFKHKANFLLDALNKKKKIQIDRDLCILQELFDSISNKNIRENDLHEIYAYLKNMHFYSENRSSYEIKMNIGRKILEKMDSILLNKNIKDIIFKCKIKFLLQNEENNLEMYILKMLPDIALDTNTALGVLNEIYEYLLKNILYEQKNCLETFTYFYSEEEALSEFLKTFFYSQDKIKLMIIILRAIKINMKMKCCDLILIDKVEFVLDELEKCLKRLSSSPTSTYILPKRNPDFSFNISQYFKK